MAEFAQTMTTLATPLKFILGAALLGVTASSLAVSLGALRGSAIIGRPFDMGVTAQLSGAEGLAAVCVSADIFFGDSQIPPNRVSIATVAGAKAHEALIRIRTDSAVNEPVVTVLLREGCSQISTRKYLVLADVQTQGATPLSVIGGEAVSPTPATAQPVTDGDSASSAGRDLGAPQAAPPKIPLRKEPLAARAQGSTFAGADSAREAGATQVRPPVSSPRRTASATPQRPRKSARSRLKLDPLDLASERDPVLRASMEMLTIPATDARQRAAAAALWQALNAQPQDVLRNSQRLTSLETDVAKILA